MTPEEMVYRHELLKLREIAHKRDFTPSGDVEYRDQANVTGKAYWAMVKASRAADEKRQSDKKAKGRK